ncbi:unnamed protein product [Calicophoron daubneyi]|uniref:Ionotropic glutamate receptor L-glutamate and glycine-binding domain-containing protein n=1 Tax=Calicophoron daubneyi TaxID=300641 RepID=A0AAV2TNA1_CALDB
MSTFNLTTELESMIPDIRIAVGMTLTEITSAEAPNINFTVHRFTTSIVCEMIADGVRTVISLTSCSKAEYIGAITDRLHILHFAIPRPFCRPKPDANYPGMAGKMHTIWYQPDPDKIFSAVHAVNQMEFASRVLILMSGTSEFTGKILGKSVESFYSRANFLPVYATQSFVPDNYTTTFAKSSNKDFGRRLSDVITALTSPEALLPNEIILSVPEDRMIQTFAQFVQHPQMAKEIVWILSDTIEMQPRKLLDFFSKFKANFMNVGYYRHVPILHREQCDSVEEPSLLIRAFKYTSGCDLTQIPERVTILMNLGVVAGHIAFNMKLFGEAHSENLTCSRSSRKIDESGLFSLQSAKSLSRLYKWDELTFFSLEVDRLGRARFVPVAAFDGQSLKLTPDGEVVASQSDVSGLFPNRFRNFSGQLLRIGVVLEPPYVMSNDVSPAGLVRNATGMVIDILESLKERFNFDYQLYAPPDGQYGMLRPDGKFSGLIGELFSRHIDMIGSFITQYNERAGVGRYIGHTSDEVIGVLVALPSFSEERLGIVKFIKLELVGPLIASAFGTSVLFWLFDRLSPYSGSRTGIQGRMGIVSSAWSVCKCTVLQGLAMFPIQSSSRTLLFAYWFLAFVISTVLQASLSATLTKKIAVLPIGGLEDLGENSEYKPLLINGSTTFDYLRTSSSRPYYQKIYDRVIANNFIAANMSEAVSMLLKEPTYAIVGDYETLGYARGVHCERLALINSNDRVGPKSQLTLSETAYAASFDGYLKMMIESGILDRMKTQWWTPDKICSKNRSNFQTLTVYSVTELLIALAATTCMGMLILGLELLWRRAKKKMRERKRRAISVQVTEVPPGGS